MALPEAMAAAQSSVLLEKPGSQHMVLQKTR
jgi:hypothetical protein